MGCMSAAGLTRRQLNSRVRRDDHRDDIEGRALVVDRRGRIVVEVASRNLSSLGPSSPLLRPCVTGPTGTPPPCGLHPSRRVIEQAPLDDLRGRSRCWVPAQRGLALVFGSAACGGGLVHKRSSSRSS